MTAFPSSAFCPKRPGVWWPVVAGWPTLLWAQHRLDPRLSPRRESPPWLSNMSGSLSVSSGKESFLEPSAAPIRLDVLRAWDPAQACEPCSPTCRECPHLPPVGPPLPCLCPSCFCALFSWTHPQQLSSTGAGGTVAEDEKAPPSPLFCPVTWAPLRQDLFLSRHEPLSSLHFSCLERCPLCCHTSKSIFEP